MTRRASLPAQRRHSPITATERRAFLEALEHGWSVKNAAERTTHARQKFYELREKDEVFAAAWAEAYKAGTEALEDEARRRAVDGFWETTEDGDGNLLRRVHRYSDPLMHRLLAARDPERFGTTSRVELTGPQGGPVMVTEHREKLTLEAALELVAERRRLAAGQPLGVAAGWVVERGEVTEPRRSNVQMRPCPSSVPSNECGRGM